MMQAMYDCTRQVNEIGMSPQAASLSVKSERRLRVIPCHTNSQENWRVYYRKLFLRMGVKPVSAQKTSHRKQ